MPSDNGIPPLRMLIASGQRLALGGISCDTYRDSYGVLGSSLYAHRKRATSQFPLDVALYSNGRQIPSLNPDQETHKGRTALQLYDLAAHPEQEGRLPKSANRWVHDCYRTPPRRTLTRIRKFCVISISSHHQNSQQIETAIDSRFQQHHLIPNLLPHKAAQSRTKPEEKGARASPRFHCETEKLLIDRSRFYEVKAAENEHPIPSKKTGSVTSVTSCSIPSYAPASFLLPLNAA